VCRCGWVFALLLFLVGSVWELCFLSFYVICVCVGRWSFYVDHSIRVGRNGGRWWLGVVAARSWGDADRERVTPCFVVLVIQTRWLYKGSR